MENALEFYKGKKVLLTGHTGFKGAWMLVLLNQLGAEVYGISLPPEENSLYEQINGEKLCKSEAFIDIRDRREVIRHLNFWEPDIIIHMAAQAIVQKSFEQALYTFQVNVEGTINLMEALRVLQNSTITLWITTDKVYENQNKGIPFKETDPLGGNDPYSASKAAMELAIKSYNFSFFKSSQHKNICLRAGNVIGGGDEAPYRLMPDIIKAWKTGEQLIIRNPESVRPWQHVLEPLTAYLLLGEKLGNAEISLGEAFNIGPDMSENKSVRDVLNIVQKRWQNLDWIDKKEDNTFGEEARVLSLNTDKLEKTLSFRRKLTYKEAIAWTLDWYENDKSPLEKCLKQIQEFLNY